MHVMHGKSTGCWVRARVLLAKRLLYSTVVCERISAARVRTVCGPTQVHYVYIYMERAVYKAFDGGYIEAVYSIESRVRSIVVVVIAMEVEKLKLKI